MKRLTRMVKTSLCTMLLGMLFLAVPSTSKAQQPSDDALSAPPAPPIMIGPGDLVDVTMFGSPELSGRFRVDEKGEIQLPLLGLVHVHGLTAEGAAKLIGRDYVAAEILEPGGAQATVFIEEYANQGITVGGEVKNPGVYPALGVRMLNNVLSAAGGVTPIAASQVIISHSSNPLHPVTVEYNPEALKPVIPEVQILPGDSIMVPRAGIVYVVGNVNKPGGYVLDGRNALTVEAAMALAAGGGRAARMKHVQLVRPLDGGRKEMITIDVDKIFKGKSPDVALKDGDILYIPTSTGKLVSIQAISSALQIGTQLTVYRTAY
jgi:polysaccharide biosynthesis/export protein